MTSIKFLLIPVLALFSLNSSSDNAGYVKKSDPVIKKASAEETFRYIRCHRKGKDGIAVTWGTNSNAGIDHFDVYHSEDGDFFDKLTTISVDNSTRYSFQHEPVFPGYHYYYIVAVMSAGPNAESMVDIVRIVSH